MDSDKISAILNEQTLLLKQILERLNRLENNQHMNIPLPQDQPQELVGTKAFQHLHSLGISW